MELLKTHVYQSLIVSDDGECTVMYSNVQYLDITNL